MRFESTAQVLAKCNLQYYRISECGRKQGLLADCRPMQVQRSKFMYLWHSRAWKCQEELQIVRVQLTSPVQN